MARETPKFEHVSLRDLKDKFDVLYRALGHSEGTELAEVLIATGRLLYDFFDEEAVDAAMAGLLAGRQIKSKPPSKWADELRRAEGHLVAKWALSSRLWRLNAFGRWGMVLAGGDETEEREVLIREDIQAVEEWRRKIPCDAWGIESEEIDGTLLRAQARFKLDMKRPVDAAELAILAGVSKGTIGNLMSGKQRVIEHKDGQISAPEALKFLTGKEEFKPSLWRDFRSQPFEERPPIKWEEFIFVPVAKTGAVFHPELEILGYFEIGRGKTKARLPNYEEALAAIQKMPVPCWRRQTAKGHWKVVLVDRWVRITWAGVHILANQERGRKAP